MDFDFSKYTIYIPQAKKCAGSLLEPEKNHDIFLKETVFDFETGIKKLQEEKRAIYLPTDESTPELIDFFSEKYEITAV